jgi:VWFA-related protein
MRSIAAIAFVLLAGAAQAQMSEVIEVHVANVDVVVLDRAGNPITGLTKDDFQLFENGKPQPLTNFYEMRSQTLATPSEAAVAAVPATVAAPPEPSAEALKRSIIIFFDSSSVAFFARNKAIGSLQRLMSTLVREGDDAMIVSWNNSMQVVQPFTSDRATLQRGVEAMQKTLTNAAGANFEKTRVVNVAANNIATATETGGRYSMQKAYEDAVAMWTDYAADVRNRHSQMMESVARLLSVLAGSDRKKVFLFMAGELQQDPGLDVLAQINGMFESAPGPKMKTMVPAQLQAKDVGISTQMRKLAEHASADGVTMYMVDVGDRQIDNNGRTPRDASVDFLSDINTLGSLGMLAETTGGAVLNGTKDFDNALREVSRDLDSYYSLGYKPAQGPKQRKIAVKVNRPGARVRTREYYSLKTGDEQVADAVVANVFHDGMKGDFPVTVKAGVPEAAEKNTFKVPVTITFPSSLTYLPDGEKMVGEYAVVFITATADGAMSPITKQVHRISFPAVHASQVGEQPMTAKATLLVRGGAQSVSVAVVDERDLRTGFGKAIFTVQ